MASKQEQALAGAGCHNPVNFAGGQPFIEYRAADFGRGGHGHAQWRVVLHGRNLNPGGHWRDYGAMPFDVYDREAKAPQLDAAMRWGAERFKIEGWEKGPYRAYYPKGFVKRRLEELLGKGNA